MSLLSGYGLKSLINFDSKISPYLRTITTIDKLIPDSLDRLKRDQPNLFVINTSPSTSSSVGHWVAVIWIGGGGTEEEPPDLFTFLDPLAEQYYHYGEELEDFVRALGDTSHLISLPFQLQPSSSTYCGLFILYLVHQLLGKRKSLAYIVDSFSSSDLGGNQRLVKRWGKFFYGPSLLSTLKRPLFPTTDPNNYIDGFWDGIG
jgi:hypothetical protein